MNTLITMQETFVSDIRSIINNARSTAVRSVDFCRVQMYWQLGKRIFEEEQQGKERADTMAHTLSRTLPFVWNQNSAADLVIVNWSVLVSFIENIQLRPQCGRN